LTYEAQKQKEEMTEAEAEELAVRKRRAEGTPCTDETFNAWCEKFEAERKVEKQKAAEEAAADSKKKGGANKDKTKVVDKSGRLTGFEQFSGKAGTVDWEAMEAATENAQRDEDEEDDEEEQDDDDGANLEDVDEELFDVDDDDLDDLDFDDDDDDDDEEEPDI
jgi:hypothetical protein